MNYWRLPLINKKGTHINIESKSRIVFNTGHAFKFLFIFYFFPSFLLDFTSAVTYYLEGFFIFLVKVLADFVKV